MATRTLVISYLSRLTNANHDGVTQQIDDRLQAYTTDNQMLTAAAAAVHQARLAEDAAYRRFSGKDFASDDLKAADQLEDKYMSTVHAILNGLLYLPESEPIRRKAQLAVQLFKDFGFSTNDGIEAEARKTTNMVQQWSHASEYTLAELAILEWVEKARQQATVVLGLVAQRVENESAKVKGELAEARKQTDQAIRKAYDVLNALSVLMPSAELSQLMSLLFSIEDRAKLYYISGGKTGGGDKPTPAPAEGDSGTGTDTGSGAGGSTGGDTGSDTGSDAGSDSGSDTGGGDTGGGEGSGSDIGGNSSTTPGEGD